MEKTFAIIKPDAVAKNQIGDILAVTEGAGFKIRAMQMTHMTRKQAEGFYAVHKERPFFGELVEFMTEGPCAALPRAGRRRGEVARDNGSDQSGERGGGYDPQAFRRKCGAQLRAR
jgi:nucleoside diphosphate kinase